MSSGVVEQRAAALRRANEVRSVRADVKRRLRARVITLERVFADPLCATARVSDLLLQLPGWGPVKVSKVLRRVQVGPSQTVGGLTVRQRAEILAEVAERDTARPVERGAAA